MIKKIIILIVMILLIPNVLADFITLDKEPEKKTNKEKLCISGLINSNNIIRFYIDGDIKKIMLEDGTTREEVQVPDGKFTNFCIDLHPGENNVKITSESPKEELKYLKAKEEFTIEFDETLPTLDITNIPEFISETKKTFTTSIDEPATLYISVNDGEEKKIEIKEAGNPELTLPPEGEFKEGNNTVKIRIVDEVGNEEILKKTITVDTKDPVIKINSVNGKSYVLGMESKFQWINIKGKTDTTNLKVYNLYDTSYYYLENKFLKSRGSTEEISELYKVEEITFKDGNFDTYVFLKPGKNKIVFLSTDQAENQNIIAADVDNINPTLIINFVSGTNWQLKSIRINPEKLDARNMLKKEGRASVEIRLSPPKDINPEDIDLDDFDFALTTDPEADPQIFDNEMIHVSSGEKSYDKKKKEFVVIQNVEIDQLGKDLTEAPDKIRGSLKGDINFYVADPMKIRPMKEHIPIDLLFYIYVSDAHYLNPDRIRWISAQLEGNLKGIENFVKKVQWVIRYNTYSCVGLVILEGILKATGSGEVPRKLLWGVCDRLACWDTPPKATDTRISPAAGTRRYVAEEEIYDETKCAPNMLSELIAKKPIFAPVRITDDLVESSKCLCFPAMWIHSQRLYATLAALQGCLNQARIGNKAPAECEVKIAQFTCDIVFGFIDKASRWKMGDKTIFNQIDNRPYEFDRKPLSAIKQILKTPIAGKLKRVSSFHDLRTDYNWDAILHEGCYILASQDWEHIEDVATQTGLEATPSFGKLVAKSHIEGKENLVIKYHIMPVFVSGLSTVQYDINFKCDTNKPNSYLCQGYESDPEGNYNLYLKSQSQDQPLKGTISPGYDLPGVIPVEDVLSKYWFNKIELKLRWSITAVPSQPFEDVIESDIEHVNEKELEKFCGEDKYKDYGICKKVMIIHGCAEQGGEICQEDEECVVEYIPAIDTDKCCPAGYCQLIAY